MGAAMSDASDGIDDGYDVFGIARDGDESDASESYEHEEEDEVDEDENEEEEEEEDDRGRSSVSWVAGTLKAVLNPEAFIEASLEAAAEAAPEAAAEAAPEALCTTLRAQLCALVREEAELLQSVTDHEIMTSRALEAELQRREAALRKRFATALERASRMRARMAVAVEARQVALDAALDALDASEDAFKDASANASKDKVDAALRVMHETRAENARIAAERDVIAELGNAPQMLGESALVSAAWLRAASAGDVLTVRMLVRMASEDVSPSALQKGFLSAAAAGRALVVRAMLFHPLIQSDAKLLDGAMDVALDARHRDVQVLLLRAHTYAGSDADAGADAGANGDWVPDASMQGARVTPTLDFFKRLCFETCRERLPAPLDVVLADEAWIAALSSVNDEADRSAFAWGLQRAIESASAKNVDALLGAPSLAPFWSISVLSSTIASCRWGREHDHDPRIRIVCKLLRFAATLEHEHDERFLQVLNVTFFSACKRGVISVVQACLNLYPQVGVEDVFCDALIAAVKESHLFIVRIFLTDGRVDAMRGLREGLLRMHLAASTCALVCAVEVAVAEPSSRRAQEVVESLVGHIEGRGDAVGDAERRRIIEILCHLSDKACSPLAKSVMESLLSRCFGLCRVSAHYDALLCACAHNHRLTCAMHVLEQFPLASPATFIQALVGKSGPVAQAA